MTTLIIYLFPSKVRRFWKKEAIVVNILMLLRYADVYKISQHYNHVYTCHLYFDNFYDFQIHFSFLRKHSMTFFKSWFIILLVKYTPKD
jgi:hypothetical protein